MRNTILWLMILLGFAYHGLAKENDYSACTQLVNTQPRDALRMAERWMQEKNHPSAYHCRALALFALERYEEAARALEALSAVITEKNLVLWGNVLRQAARSWELAEDNAKAIIVLTNGINKTDNLGLSEPVVGQLCADMLLDRSALYAKGGRELFALQDLDQALSLSPKNPKLLFARAELFAKQEEYALARRDLDTLKQINPNYPGAKRLRATLR